MKIFVFNLDGTVTSKETLPIIASHFGIQELINQLTHETIVGNIPFIESFIRRVHILGRFPVSEINTLLENVPFYEKIHRFVGGHKDNCVIATENLGEWIKKLSDKFGCACYHSSGIIENDRVIKLTHILRKEHIVEHFKSQGHKVIFIGEGNNDMEAMRLADVSIASGVTHKPANSVLSITDYLVFKEEALCRLLHQLL